MSAPVYATLHKCKTFRLKGMPFIPHYSIPGLYVGPGGVELNATRLQALGAQPSSRMLWKREWAVQAKQQAE